MILTIIIFLATYLLSSDGTAKGRKKALLAATVAGAGTAFVTSQTNWGRGINSDFNGWFGLDDSWSGFGDSTTKPAVGNDSADPPKLPNNGAGSGTKPANGSWWRNLPSWVAPAAGAAAGVAVGSGLPGWVLWAAGGLLVYSLLK